ncbi:hypothetical protein WJX74_003724 [Apatococcus lobatus]|uniref:AAA+ ATPase domain-containing protein n=1 Tax=Apatococcus lobatus TaxID=904363 RepID=A0AAW1R025_9CHLO
MSRCGLLPQGPLRCEGKRPPAPSYREVLARCPWQLPARSEGRQAGQDVRNSGSALYSCSAPASPWSTVVGRPDRRLQPVQAAGSAAAQASGSLLEDIKDQAQRSIEALLTEVQSGSRQRGAAVHGGNTIAEMRPRLERAIDQLQSGLIERDTEVRLLLLAAMAGEHILYIGPPGTAKSELGRRLAALYEGSFFERLLTRFSVPEELFGPLSMRALEEDQYVRQIEGYLPDATVAFIDEVFKANSAILNTLLTILNERLFDNGSVRSRVPLLCLVGASNELPESEELDALYDRFLIRRQVGQVSDAGLTQLLGSSAVQQAAISSFSASARDSGSIAFQQQDFANIREQAVKTVSVPTEVVNVLTDLRAYLQDKLEPPVYVSDRRLVKSVALLQVAAYTSGRSSISLHDCLLLQHVLWQRPEEADKIGEFLMSQLAADDGLQQANYIFSGLFQRACQKLSDKRVQHDLAEELGGLKSALMERLEGIAGSLSDERKIVDGNLWLGQDEAEAVASQLAPKLERSRGDIEAMLFEVVTLEALLRNGAQVIHVATLLPERWRLFLTNKPKGDKPR